MTQRAVIEELLVELLDDRLQADDWGWFGDDGERFVYNPDEDRYEATLRRFFYGRLVLTGNLVDHGDAEEVSAVLIEELRRLYVDMADWHEQTAATLRDAATGLA